MLRTPLRAVLATALTIACYPGTAARAEPCTRDTLRRVVDEAGARLRVLTADTQPRVMASLRRLKEKRGWTGADADDKAAALMADERTAELDAKSAGLLARIDELSEVGTTDEPDCSRLAELEATSIELQATVRAKSQHILARLDQEANAGAGQAQVQAPAPPTPAPPPMANATPAPAAAPPPLASPPAAAPPAAAPTPQAEPAQPKREASAQPVERSQPPAVVPAKPKRAPVTGWTTETVERQASPPLTEAEPPLARDLPPPRAVPPSLMPAPQADGFSREEIAEASRGFFGTISGGLGSVMEHAFSTLGRPSGYVLGNEGGGAFIAGLRYGKGTLFLRDGTKRDVYWHGPSIGYDFGASGSKTLFLVYNLKNDLDIFAGFSGVDGSAYLVGGVGMTVLTDGKVVMAPIRSGIGVRLGANIGYVRFTARPTWNPF